MKTQTKHSLMLMLCAFIWGTAFVAQSAGSGMGAYSFLAGRSWLAVLVLIPTVFAFDTVRKKQGQPYGWPKEKSERKTLLVAGLVCGTFLFAASAAQQIGITIDPSTAKAAFLTAMYVVLVPVFGLFLGRKGSAQLWVSMVIAVAGLYMLCMKNGFGGIETSDWILLSCAVLFSFQIMSIDHFSPLVDGVRLSLIQFIVVAVESSAAALIFETPTLAEYGANLLPGLLRRHVQRRGLYASDPGPERAEPRHRQPYHVFGKRIQCAGRLAAAGPEPFDAGERRLRPHLRRRRAVSAAPCGAAQMQKERVMLRAAGGIPYELTRGRVKRLNLHVRRDGTVALSIPLRTTLEAADAYVIAEAEWIRAAQARQAAREKRQEELPDKAAALAHFTAMSDKVYPAFAGVLGGQKPTIKVRSMTSRWGVCHMAKRQITFALQLYNMPEAAQIYVVVHEYCHFLQPNHSPAFWAEVAKLMPDWKARRDLLK